MSSGDPTVVLVSFVVTTAGSDVHPSRDGDPDGDPGDPDGDPGDPDGDPGDPHCLWTRGILEAVEAITIAATDETMPTAETATVTPAGTPLPLEPNEPVFVTLQVPA